MSLPTFDGWTCPVPLQNYPTIVMGHGAGGRMMADLIQHLFAPAFDNEWLGQMGDSTAFEIASARIGRTAASAFPPCVSVFASVAML